MGYSYKRSMYWYGVGVIVIGLVGFLYGLPWIGVAFCLGGVLLFILGNKLR